MTLLPSRALNYYTGGHLINWSFKMLGYLEAFGAFGKTVSKLVASVRRDSL